MYSIPAKTHRLKTVLVAGGSTARNVAAMNAAQFSYSDKNEDTSCRMDRNHGKLKREVKSKLNEVFVSRLVLSM